MSIATDRAIGAVSEWSARIHGAGSDRDLWCMAAARAILAGQPLPPAGPGTAFHRRTTAADRAGTIRRILVAEGVRL